MVTTIKIQKKPKLNKPVLIVGLPGVGNVGRMVVKHLIKEWKAERFATLISDRLPHKVIMKKDGTLRMVNNRFYYIKQPRKGNDIVFLTGDDQPMTPEGQYEVNTRILDFFTQELGGVFVYTIGGYNSPMPYEPGKKAKVFGNATDKHVLNSFKSEDVVFGESRGFILGSAGMLVAFAKQAKVPGICLMGESKSIDIDPLAAKSVTEVVSKRLGIKASTKEFDEMTQKLDKIINKLQEEMQNSAGTQMHMNQDNPGAFSYIR